MIEVTLQNVDFDYDWQYEELCNQIDITRKYIESIED
jgi:hypothetical protein